MDKLNEWTKAAIAWAKDNPATVILMGATLVACFKVGEAIGDAIVEAAEAKSQS